METTIEQCSKCGGAGTYLTTSARGKTAMRACSACSPAAATEPAEELTVRGLHEALFRRLPLPTSKNAAILDLGCGTGAWLSRLERAGYTNLLGVDAHERPYGRAYVGHAKRQVADLDAPDLGLGDRRFDAIFALEVIEHLEAPGFLLRHIARHLAPDGFALITTPNIHSLVSRIRYALKGRLGQFDEQGELSHVTPMLLDGVRRMGDRHGLVVDETWGYPDDGTSKIYRRPLVMAAKVLRRLGVPDPTPGDSICVLLRPRRPT